VKNDKNMKEKISALADGELSDFEVRRVLSEIAKNPEYRKFWQNIQQTGEILTDEKHDFLNNDISQELFLKISGKKLEIFEEEEIKSPRMRYIAASFVGFFAVIIYSVFPVPENSFTDIASKKIDQAIESPGALEVLNNSVSGLNAVLQDYELTREGTLANYRFPNSGKTFKVSLYPIQEINKIGIKEATKISYIKSKKGIYIVSVSGNISSDQKNQILQKANLFANQLK
tara:strand:+ start:731 stop:1420 length:690 start_codon:yes stop_codon:yes gene_type:complete